MEPQRRVLPAAAILPPKELEGMVARIADLVGRPVTPDEDVPPDDTGWGVVYVVLLPQTLGAGSYPGPTALPARAQVRADEKFAWGLADGKNLRTLKRFFLIGWAYMHGASSLRDALRKLQPYRESLGAAIIPASTKDYSDCAKEITERFAAFLCTEGGAEVEIFVRKGVRPAFTDRDHQDTRPIIGLTEVGWEMWRGTGRFLTRHGGPGPWVAASVDA